MAGCTDANSRGLASSRRASGRDGFVRGGPNPRKPAVKPALEEQMARLLEQGFQEENSSVNHAPIAVLGAGRMGRGIALAYAFAGVSVVLIDLKSRPKGDQERLFAEVALELDADLEFMCEAGLLPPQAKESVAKLVTCVGREGGQSELPKCDIVYEAVPERMDAKTDAFRYAGPLLREDAVIASTTSTFLVTDLMSLCSKPARCINAHWLNPAHLIPLVELSRDTTAEQDALELYCVKPAKGHRKSHRRVLRHARLYRSSHTVIGIE